MEEMTTASSEKISFIVVKFADSAYIVDIVVSYDLDIIRAFV